MVDIVFTHLPWICGVVVIRNEFYCITGIENNIVELRVGTYNL